MSKPRAIFAAALLICAGAAGCKPAADTPITEDDISPISYDKMREFNRWLEEEKNKTAPQAFKPAPMRVTGVGRVKAAPDIAVVTGTIITEADQDDTAIDEAAVIINAVQEAVTGQDVELNFTAIATSEKRDSECLARNNKAQARYRRIVQDNRYNANIKRQREQGRDVKIKPRPPLGRLAYEICPVTHIEARLAFSARVKPAAQAGNIINDFTSAGVSKVDLFGYDFTDYDALYKDAAAKAVANAKDKAERVAGIAGTQLTEIVSFTVDRPQRTARFGPQAMIVSNHGNRNVSAGSYGNQGGAVLAPAPMPAPPPPPPVVAYAPPPPGNYEMFGVTSSAYSSSAYSSAQRPTAHLDEIITTGVPNEPLNPNTGSANNALKMSLQAGQRTITVNAYLEYLYETPIDGSIAPDKS